ncbi:unnamed protein product [Acanthosepion pharaonis]|uniref:Uncharacterized protein n=1 Tax=Acanthosepion pharaonis TaxID=158019 RepID=A0A812DQE4_ACAPH|nr:unnamed protein product [Sepia pharaonis]
MVEQAEKKAPEKPDWIKQAEERSARLAKTKQLSPASQVPQLQKVPRSILCGFEPSCICSRQLDPVYGQALRLPNHARASSISRELIHRSVMAIVQATPRKPPRRSVSFECRGDDRPNSFKARQNTLTRATLAVLQTKPAPPVQTGKKRLRQETSQTPNISSQKIRQNNLPSDDLFLVVMPSAKSVWNPPSTFKVTCTIGLCLF